MYYNLLTQKRNPAYSRLKRLTKLLRNFIDVERIYFSRHIGKPVNQGILTVIISEDSPHYWDDIYEYLWKVIASFPEFSIRIYNEEWLHEGIEEGCLFFILHCRRNALIYSETTHKFPRHKKINCKSVVKLAEKRLKEYTNENQVMGRDLKYHLRNDNYTLALYTLHQQLRNLYICTSWLVSGEWYVLQSLAEQGELLSRFTGLPQMLFSPDKEDDNDILEQLDKACDIIQGRTNENQSISKDAVNAASIKLELAVTEVKTLFANSIKRAQEILKSGNNEKSGESGKSN